MELQKMAEAGKRGHVEGRGEGEKDAAEEMEVDEGEGANRETEVGWRRQEDFREMVKRMAQERVAARGGGGVRGRGGEGVRGSGRKERSAVGKEAPGQRTVRYPCQEKKGTKRVNGRLHVSRGETSLGVLE